ncbi:hypothetical protein FDUTEX481_02537 [Tolypothrix sp. PCC 7601]|nr:hypothetical protein FDUTEX481_02537 [Tolypothrix sp. PCC 7601]
MRLLKLLITSIYTSLSYFSQYLRLKKSHRESDRNYIAITMIRHQYI